MSTVQITDEAKQPKTYALWTHFMSKPHTRLMLHLAQKRNMKTQSGVFFIEALKIKNIQNYMI
jgi:hypothetical protein